MIVRAIIALCLASVTACSSVTPNSSESPPFEETAFIRSGGVETLFNYPYVFQENASLAFHQEEDNRLGFCLTLNDEQTCGVLDQEPVPVAIIEFYPHCQDETLAIEIAAHHGQASTFYIFYVDGEIAETREQAEQLTANDPACNFERRMWEENDI